MNYVTDIPKLLLHTKTTRVARVNPIYDHSKYIVRGQEVVELGNHRVWRIRKISLVFRIGNYIAILLQTNQSYFKIIAHKYIVSFIYMQVTRRWR